MTSPAPRIGLLGDGPVSLAYGAAVQRVTATAPTVAPIDALLNDRAISAVVVASHGDGDAVAAALAVGKQVLIDPGTIRALDRHGPMRETALASGSLIVARPWRWHDVCRSLRAAVDAGDLGPPAWFQWVSEGTTTRLAGDGATATAQAVIGIDLALWLLGGDPARVLARSTGSNGVAIALRFAGGANALLELRPRLADGAGHGLAWLLGPRGEARWEQRADTLTIDQSGVRFAPLDFRPCLDAAVGHALACWRGEADLAAEAAQTRTLLAVADAVNESLRQSQPVAIEPVVEGTGR